MKTRTIAIVFSAAILGAGCASQPRGELQPTGTTEFIRNAQGHVVGHKEMLCDCKRGEDIARIQLYIPRVDDQGRIVGYEEPMKGRHAVIRDLNGRRVGNRYVDLRSRATNSGNRGLTILVLGKPAPHLALAAAPSPDELMHLARLGN